MTKNYFVTGIGTDIGKTVVSAAIVDYLQADYWKPVQAGYLDNSDSLVLKNLISNSITYIHPEVYKLSQPTSPHAAARYDGLQIEVDRLIIPKTQNKYLIIEGAGGLMVPLNEKYLVIDFIKKTGAEVILVSKNYLGSINHTLLSIDALRNRGIPIKGLIFNGDENRESEVAIQNYFGTPILFHIPQFLDLNQEAIHNFVGKLPASLLN